MRTVEDIVKTVDRFGAGLLIVGAFTAALVGHASFGLGLILGGLASLINFRLLARNARKLVGMDPRQAARQSFASLGYRFPIMAGALAIACAFPDTFHIAGCAAGLFTSQAIVLVAGLRTARD